MSGGRYVQGRSAEVAFCPFTLPKNCFVSVQTFNLLYFLRIFILESPPTQFTEQPRAGSADVLGYTKVLLCSADGVPAPVYRWRKNGLYIPSTSGGAGSAADTTLKIRNIQRTDAGVYQCVAANAFGSLLSNSAVLQVACKWNRCIDSLITGCRFFELLVGDIDVSQPFITH